MLLGFLADEGRAQCTRHEKSIAEKLSERIGVHEKHFPDDVDAWLDRQRLWRPVVCEVSFISTSHGAFTAAPVVTLAARRDVRNNEGPAERFVRFSLCSRGFIRIEHHGWPNEAPSTTLPKIPANVVEAQRWAHLAIERAMPTLLTFDDPTRPLTA